MKPLHAALPMALLTAVLAPGLVLAQNALPAAASSQPSTSAPEDAIATLAPVVVTGQSEPGQVRIDTRAPEEPVRMTDGASLLKSVPNMSVVRKGQQSSDPVFRGLGGSRLAITANDQFLYGGCGIRMDTPTAYINPQAYDEMLVIKGPQTVLKGPGLVAGAVQFIRHPKQYTQFAAETEASVTGGSFGYLDAYADLSVGNPLASLRAIATHSQSDDYEDGDGNAVRSWYERKSASVNLGLTPSSDLRFDLFVDTNRSQAKFASLHLDAGKTDRDSIGGKVQLKNVSPLVRELLLETGYSHQDIIMGRQFRGLLAGGNPDRVTRNAKFSSDLAWSANNRGTLGLEWFGDEHRARPAYKDVARSRSETSSNLGVFYENTLQLTDDSAWVAGLRHDRTKARTYPGFWYSDTPQQRNSYSLTAGFSRYEFQMDAWRNYVGLGYTERAPDFWERGDNRGVQPEKSLQLDVGGTYTQDSLRLTGAFFANQIKDYILIEKDQPLLNDLAASSVARNIDALRYGFELGGEYTIASHWLLGADLAYTWGRNQTEGRPLGQTPPLEAKLRAGYKTDEKSLMATLRAVARQNRVSVGQGNVNGVDIGATPGFAVLGIHGHWRIAKQARLGFGIDNLFNRTYAEHLTKAMQTPEFFNGLGVNPNIGSSTRINEPGRSLWVRLDMRW